VVATVLLNGAELSSDELLAASAAERVLLSNEVPFAPAWARSPHADGVEDGVFPLFALTREM
jgi:hypothetical protein